jgi:hypothetical protein
MKRPKYFGSITGVIATIDYFQDEINDCDGEMELFGEKRDIGGPMWCSSSEEFIEFFGSWHSCGNTCADYNPCNGKSGRCRHLKNGFIETSQKYILTTSGLKEV